MAVNIKTGEEKYFDSRIEARKELHAAAHEVANGKATQSNGYVFYDPSDDEEENKRRKEAAINLALTKGGKGSNKRKPVIATNIETGEKKQYRSAVEARNAIPAKPCVYDVLSGKIKQSKGYTFEYIGKEGR